MKLRTMLLLAILSLLFTECEDIDIKANDLITSLTFDTTETLADGSGTVTVTAILNKDADESKRTVKFTASSSKFKESDKDEVSVTAEETLNKELVAETELVIPNTAKDIIVTAEVEKYEVSETLQLNASEPISIVASSSSFSVQANYGSEIVITATLLNENQGKVSTGNKVIFNDYYKGTEIAVTGKFREVTAESNSDSKVSAIYTPGNIAPDTTIVIQVSLETNPEIFGSTEIYVTPKQ